MKNAEHGAGAAGAVKVRIRYGISRAAALAIHSVSR
jgi:hypothetical protein